MHTKKILTNHKRATGGRKWGQREWESEDKRSWNGESEDDMEWGWSAIMRQWG